MIAIVICLIFLLVFVMLLKGRPMWDDAEEVETTTTLATYSDEPQCNVIGTLERGFEDGQAFVIDPVDRKRIWLNSSDDMYEDANGKIWALR